MLIERLKSMKRHYVFWREQNFTGEYELTILPQYVDNAKLAIDVGGNIGSYTYPLSRLAKQVVTFEPNPLYLERLRALRLNNVTFEDAALSDRSGSAPLRIPVAASGEEDQGMASIDKRAIPGEISRAFDVKTRRLDDYGFDNVGFVKIDVEGHEEAVLQGALQTLERNRPVLLVEIEERRNPGAVGRVREQLRELGFAGYLFRDGAKRPINTFDPAVDQPESLVWDRRRHTRRSFPMVNNFLFVPERRATA